MIRIENGIVTVPQAVDIRMTTFEIAILFEVYVQTVNANIKAVLKSGVINVDICSSATVAGNIIMPDTYGLEMIIALSFRIQSRNAEVFRKYLLGKVFKKGIPEILTMSIQNPILN